jgi:uncharacterized protein
MTPAASSTGHGTPREPKPRPEGQAIGVVMPSSSAYAAAKAPILAITGAKDLQVDPADLDRMAEPIPTELERHLVPDVTHLLRVEYGQPSLRTYKDQARDPIDPRVITCIRTWLETKAHSPAE